jgi:hypothetical protein
MEQPLADIRKFYERTIQKYEETEYYARYPLNFFWATDTMQAMRHIIQSAESEADVIHGAQRTFMFSVNVSDEEEQLAVDWLLSEQRSRNVDLFSFPSALQESAFSYPPNNVLREERLLTPDFLRTVNIAHGIASRIQPGSQKLTAIELGGGLGHLARTMRVMGLTKSHTIVDIPETLVFSYCFLKTNFPDATFLLVDDTMPADAQLTGYDFCFVPALFADRSLDSEYDIFINTASMGEMRNEAIRYWMNFIQTQLHVRYLYTLNRYLNTMLLTGHNWRLEENECSVHYDSRWEILQWEVEPSFTRCPYVDTQISRYVEILAKRLHTVDTEVCRKRASELLRALKREDWCRMPPSFPSVMTMRDNVLVHDMSMSGTLFKLWDTLRLHPTAEAVALMLQYLSTLLRHSDKLLEEVPYYENMLLALVQRAPAAELQPLVQQVCDKRLERLAAAPLDARLIEVDDLRRMNIEILENVRRISAEFQAIRNTKVFRILKQLRMLRP